MDIVIVYKPDGTRQCEDQNPVPVSTHAGELSEMGATEIFGQGNVPGPEVILRQCGLPTGQVNAFAILKDDWEGPISRGIVGPRGFALWSGTPAPDLGLDASCRLVRTVGGGNQTSGARSALVLIRELIGRPCRYYRQGDPLTEDFVPDRVNIEHDENHRITDIWVG